MKVTRLFVFVAVLLSTAFSFGLNADAQGNATITGTVQASDNNTWNYATWTIGIDSPQGPVVQVCGGSLNVTVSGTLSSAGAFASDVVTTNACLSPPNSTYAISICPQVTASPCQVVHNITISGTTMNLAAVINAALKIPSFDASISNPATVPFAYATSQVMNPFPGLMVYLVASQYQCFSPGTGWSNCNAAIGTGSPTHLPIYLSGRTIGQSNVTIQNNNPWTLNQTSGVMVTYGPSIWCGEFAGTTNWTNGCFQGAFPNLMASLPWASGNVTIYNASRCNQTTFGAITDMTTGSSGCSGNIAVPALSTLAPSAGSPFYVLISGDYVVNDCQWTQASGAGGTGPPLTTSQSIQYLETLASDAYAAAGSAIPTIVFVTSIDGWMPAIPGCAQQLHDVNQAISDGVVANGAGLPAGSWMTLQMPGQGLQLNNTLWNTDHIHPLEPVHIAVSHFIDSAMRNRGIQGAADAPGTFNGIGFFGAGLTVGETQSGVVTTFNTNLIINDVTSNVQPVSITSSDSNDQTFLIWDKTSSSIPGFRFLNTAGTAVAVLGPGNATAPSPYTGVFNLDTNTGNAFAIEIGGGTITDYFCPTTAVGGTTPTGWFGVHDTSCKYPISATPTAAQNSTHLYGGSNGNTAGYDSFQFTNSSGTTVLTMGVGNPSAATFANEAFIETNAGYPLIINVSGTQRAIFDSTGTFAVGTNVTGNLNAFFVTATGNLTANTVAAGSGGFSAGGTAGAGCSSINATTVTVVNGIVTHC